MKRRAFAAELVGTFALTFSGLISIHYADFPIPAPALAGLTLGVIVHLLGPVSGCLLNPAVALGIGSFSLPYVWGPVVGAVAGAHLSRYVCDPGGRTTRGG